MKQLSSKIKPSSTLWQIAHFLYVVLLPIILYICVNRGLVLLGIGFVALSKWRVFAIRPRYWVASLRANAVDLSVGISTAIFMSQTQSALIQLIWAVSYAFWLIVIKTLTSTAGVSIQALIAFVYGLMAIYLAFGGSAMGLLILLTWALCYSVAHHFLSSFEELHIKFIANIFAFFGAALTWILSHWLLFYGIVAQPALLLMIIGVYLSILYALYKYHRLSPMLKTIILLFLTFSVTLIIIFSDWSDKTL